MDRHPVALLSKCGLDLRLPAPPMPGTPILRPLRTTRQFLAVAKLFQNCLELRLDDALSGVKAFYIWMGAEALVVELSLVDGLWWRLSEINGYRNLGHRDGTDAALAAELGLADLNRTGWQAGREELRGGGRAVHRFAVLVDLDLLGYRLHNRLAVE